MNDVMNIWFGDGTFRRIMMQFAGNMCRRLRN